MDFEQQLNEFQKKRIKERLLLDFNKELKKESLEKEIFNKNLKNHLDIFSTQLYHDGILFYGLTIKIPFLNKSDPELWYYTHLQIEKWVNEFRDKIELIEFCYLSIELFKSEKKYKKNKNLILYDSNSIEGKPYFHALIGVRSIIGKNNCHFNEIRKIFNLSYYDIKIKNLSSLKLIRSYWNFILKEKNYKFHRFCQYSRYYEVLYGGIADLELQYDNDRYAFVLDLELNSKNADIEGIKDRNPDLLTIINYLITLYMYTKNYYINNNFLYKKLEYSQYSWELIDTIDFFNNNNITILNELKELFPQQLSNLKISKLINNVWDVFFNSLKTKNHYIPFIKFRNDIIEFKDGIYFVTENKFLSYKNDFIKINNILTNDNSYIFINKNYKNLTKPKRLLKYININEFQIENFCFIFAKKMHMLLNNKKFSTENVLVNYFFSQKFNLNKSLELEFKKEFSEIIIYCNRIFFKSKKLS